MPTTVDGYAVVALGRRRLRPATVALYDRLLRLAILPAFGGRELRDITSAEVTAWYGSMKRTPTQQANAYGLLKSILKDAVDDGLIVANPCRVKAGAQKTRAREIEVLTVRQLEAYLAALPENRRVPLLLAGWCGLRSGEVRGLRVRDLDLDAGVVHVRHAVVRVTGQLIIGPPKTAAGIRTVAIPPHLMPVLRVWLTAQPPRKRDALLFPAGDGVSPLNDSVLRDAHDKAKAAIGVPGLTIHALRHTSATLAAQLGATLAELQARIGHSTANMAMRYQHVAAERDAQLAARMSALAAAQTRAKIPSRLQVTAKQPAIPSVGDSRESDNRDK
ncbi:MAG TPA: tyrosine-type recombinase/integrase [Propionicimonas sp.]|nr:tyrosine-type recombinase/integrase [Propionicimonas sp.]HQA79080.1 tyrosine-type recombinase/integrase [Propionicimonas sp.]